MLRVLTLLLRGLAEGLEEGLGLAPERAADSRRGTTLIGRERCAATPGGARREPGAGIANFG